MESVKYQMNQPVFYEGMPSDFIMIVKSGHFEITRTYDEENCYLCGKESSIETRKEAEFITSKN